MTIPPVYDICIILFIAHIPLKIGVSGEDKRWMRGLVEKKSTRNVPWDLRKLLLIRS